MKKRTKWIWIGAAVVAAGIAYGLATSGSGLPVETARVARGPLTVVVTEQGKTRVHTRYVVAAPVTGLMDRVSLEEGDPVQPGTLITRMYAAPQSARDLRIARAQLAAAEANRREAAAKVEEVQNRIAQLERDVARDRKLTTSGAGTPDQLEHEQLSLATARQQLEGAQASVHAADADIVAARAAVVGESGQSTTQGAPVELRSPGQGRVLRVLQQSRRVVQAGTPIVAIGDPDHIEVVIDVLSQDAVRIKPGDRVLLSDWGGKETLDGAVRRIEPEAFTKVSALGVEEQRVHVIAELDHPPPALGAGYRVEAAIVTWSGKGLLTVPTSALFQRGRDWQVFVVEDGKAALRKVQLGRRSTDAAQVEKGLAEGDRVILFPTAKVHDGVKVATGASRQGPGGARN